MTKITGTVALAIGLLIAPSWQAQESYRDACIQRCEGRPGLGDPEVQRQEIVSLEKEAARAIQLNNGTYFQRVYSDDFAGTLSHGQLVNKTQWIGVIESPAVKYESFNASDIKVRVFEYTAVATCLWSARSIIRGQHISSQIRAIHVYVDTPRGWHVVSAQTTNLPPDVQQPL
ncbi:MAG TPA: nuclear transport factor 2 family protein [Candidatus Acidoferrum sp.]|nr:nuclear transport factor 2 family protein [Candidatus Acidoferrum sp.]